MTREEIMAMPECLDLDHLVAERVMHWHREGGKWMREDGKHTGYVVEPAVEYPLSSFRPSIDISDAWEVIEKLDYSWQFSKHGPGSFPFYFVIHHANRQGGDVWASGKTAPLAICRALLILELSLK